MNNIITWNTTKIEMTITDQVSCKCYMAENLYILQPWDRERDAIYWTRLTFFPMNH